MAAGTQIASFRGAHAGFLGDMPDLALCGYIWGLKLPDSVTTAVYFVGRVPDAINYAGGGLTVNFLLGSTAALSGNIVIETAFKKLADGVSLDDTGFDTTKTTTCSSLPGSANQAYSKTISHSSSEIGGLAAGDMYVLRLRRLGADAGDTSTGAPVLLAVSVAEA